LHQLRALLGFTFDCQNANKDFIRLHGGAVPAVLRRRHPWAHLDIADTGLNAVQTETNKSGAPLAMRGAHH
jgi:hypothetical protein